MIGLLSLSAACTGSEEASQAQAQGQQQRPPQQVGVITLEARNVDITTEVAGRVTPYKTVEVRPQVDGVIAEQVYEDATEVEPGDVLYRIDDDSYTAQVEAARADVARAEASLSSTESRWQRYQRLLNSSAISEQEAEDARSAYLEARAGVAQAQAALKSAEINQRRTVIQAPIAGLAERSSVNQGALVTAGQSTPLTTIRQVDPIYVDLTESSERLVDFRRRMETGEITQNGKDSDEPSATITLEFADGRKYPLTGTVSAADMVVSETTGTLIFRTVFDNPDRLLLPGMYMRATVTLGETSNGILVPQRAVTRNQRGEPVAWFVSEEGTAVRRQLTIARDVDQNWLVTGGASSGDRLIVDGIQKIGEGAPVDPLPVTVGEDGLVAEASADDAGAQQGASEGTEAGSGDTDATDSDGANAEPAASDEAASDAAGSADAAADTQPDGEEAASEADAGDGTVDGVATPSGAGGETPDSAQSAKTE
ncbi:efflux RND transporter periplasmic adaptor subunit [Jiella marina]|uniref:efflux RND transporter periplasmic adaptor subunit n=1 Tax=Jiella sp. LLJ827 TaxID=2917712 RepID=UPI0021009F79|nr:efflux RND transporter periplasmic adaptor subunit [Jiella sp. LLJ827]MCQ0986830.1 efflux RND transporter periplasmic adaptor subunit [Jiella sp. LLJ827]